MEIVRKKSLKLKSENVILEDENGSDAHYTIRELTGKERAGYLTFMASRASVNQQTGEARIKDARGIDSGLLKLCLYDSAGKLVPETIIEAWPSSTVEYLSGIASKLSALRDTEEGNG